jgi:hypothetical protein
MRVYAVFACIMPKLEQFVKLRRTPNPPAKFSIPFGTTFGVFKKIWPGGQSFF